MFRQRFFSGMLGAALVVALVRLGGFPFLGLVVFATILGEYEFYHLLRQGGFKPLPWLGYLGSLAFTLLAYYSGTKDYGALVTAIILLFMVYQLLNFRNHTVIDAMVTAYSCLYTGLLFSFVILLRNLPGGAGFITLTFFGTWMCDVMAYFIGIKYGKRKLCPQISPSKTIAGAWGGLVGSLVTVVGIGLWLGLPLLHLAILSGIISLTAEAGDLVESAIKRQAGVKDSGRFLPGHGGMLDRCDSLLFTAPAVYYYLLLLIL